MLYVSSEDKLVATLHRLKAGEVVLRRAIEYTANIARNINGLSGRSRD